MKTFIAKTKSYNTIIFFLFVVICALTIGTMIVALPYKWSLAAFGSIFSLIFIYKFPDIYLGIHISGLIPVLLWSAGLRETTGWSALLVLAVCILALRLKENWQGLFIFPILSQYIFGFYILLSLFGMSEMSEYSVEKIRYFFGWAFIPFIGAVVCTLSGKLKPFLYSFFSGYVICTLFSVSLAKEVLGSSERVTTMFYDTIMTGRIAGFALLFALWMFFHSKRIYGSVLSLILSAPLVFVLAVTQTRGAVVAFLFGLSTILLIRKLELKTVGWICGIVIVALCFFWFVPIEQLARFTQSSDDLLTSNSVATRIDLYKEAIAVFFENPLLGVGIGGGHRHLFFDYPHNIIFEIAAELGLIGLCLFLYMIVIVIKRFISLMRNYSKDPFVEISMASFLFALVAAQFSYDIQRNGLIWVFGGVILAMSWMKQNSNTIMNKYTMKPNKQIIIS